MITDEEKKIREENKEISQLITFLKNIKNNDRFNADNVFIILIS